MKFNPAFQSRQMLIWTYGLGSLAWVTVWYGLKVAHFEALDYSCDLFSSLQSSRSWHDGFPLLYEFRYGDTLRYHTYFLTLAFAPFTLLLGAKGLFLVHAVVVWLAPFAALGQTRDLSRTRWLLLLLTTLYWGPYGAWIYDDVRFGWHLELLYFPVGIVLAAALWSGRTWAIVGAGILVCLLREDGPVLGFCLHVFVQSLRQRGFVGWPWLRVVRFLFPIIAGWAALFCLAMSVLFFHSVDHELRAASAFHSFAQLLVFKQATSFVVNLGQAGVMLAPAGLLVGWWAGWRLLGWLALLSTPLVVVALVGSAYYQSITWLGLSWAPRMAMLLGYLLGALLCLVLHAPPQPAPVPARLLRIGVLLVLGQWLGLALARHYNGLQRDIQTVWLRAHETSDSVPGQLKMLATTIPHRAYVAADYRFYASFEWHRYVWLESGYLQNSPIAQPDFIVTTPNSSMPFDWDQIPKTAYFVRDSGALRVYQRKQFR